MSLAVWREAVIIALVLAVLAEYRVLACGLAVWLSVLVGMGLTVRGGVQHEMWLDAAAIRVGVDVCFLQVATATAFVLN